MARTNSKVNSFGKTLMTSVDETSTFITYSSSQAVNSTRECFDKRDLSSCLLHDKLESSRKHGGAILGRLA